MRIHFFEQLFTDLGVYTPESRNSLGITIFQTLKSFRCSLDPEIALKFFFKYFHKKIKYKCVRKDYLFPQFQYFWKCSLGSRILRSQFFPGSANDTPPLPRWDFTIKLPSYPGVAMSPCLTRFSLLMTFLKWKRSTCLPKFAKCFVISFWLAFASFSLKDLRWQQSSYSNSSREVRSSSRERNSTMMPYTLIKISYLINIID